MSLEEKIVFIYDISTMFGRVVTNVERWNVEDIDHEVSELEGLLSEEN